MFKILTIVRLYQIRTPLRRHLHDRCDLRSLRPCLETKRRRQRDGPRHRQRRTVEWTQFAGGRPQAAKKRAAGLCVGAAWIRRPAVRFDHSPFEYDGRLSRITNNEPRLFLGLGCGVPPRQTQADDDASGSPQRVAGRLARTVPYDIAYRRWIKKRCLHVTALFIRCFWWWNRTFK